MRKHLTVSQSQASIALFSAAHWKHMNVHVRTHAYTHRHTKTTHTLRKHSRTSPHRLPPFPSVHLTRQICLSFPHDLFYLSFPVYLPTHVRSAKTVGTIHVVKLPSNSSGAWKDTLSRPKLTGPRQPIFLACVLVVRRCLRPSRA
jgi:hypothetical protein